MSKSEALNIAMQIKLEYETVKNSKLYVYETRRLEVKDYCYLLDYIHEMYGYFVEIGQSEWNDVQRLYS